MQPTTDSNTQKVVARPLQQGTPSGGKGVTSVSRLEGIRKMHLAEGISKQASDLILSGWSKRTNTTYQSGWSKWASWCASREIDPFSGDVHYFLDFLAGLFNNACNIGLSTRLDLQCL